ncbi:MAG TPA: SMC-Scp complex subunit ScpB, partial [Bdellovibrionales bacterium]|nr:SMC-Scp complex subunit ScpB [Bdellovibrionales bacterium]
MYYETTRKFLEIFGLRNLQELPSLHEIDQLIPEGIGETEEKETLSDLTGQLSTEVTDKSYSVGEEELLKITDELSTITTSSDFFEQEKQRMREKRDADRAQDIRERITIEEQVDEKDRRWLERYEAGKMADAKGSEEIAFVTEGLEASAESASSDDVPNVVDATEEGTFDAEPSDDVPRDQEL